jgi:hypothetical protein
LNPHALRRRNLNPPATRGSTTRSYGRRARAPRSVQRGPTVVIRHRARTLRCVGWGRRRIRSCRRRRRRCSRWFLRHSHSYTQGCTHRGGRRRRTHARRIPRGRRTPRFASNHKPDSECTPCRQSTPGRSVPLPMRSPRRWARFHHRTRRSRRRTERWQGQRPASAFAPIGRSRTNTSCSHVRLNWRGALEATCGIRRWA